MIPRFPISHILTFDTVRQTSVIVYTAKPVFIHFFDKKSTAKIKASSKGFVVGEVKAAEDASVNSCMFNERKLLQSEK